MNLRYVIFFVCLALLSCKEKGRKLPYYNTSDFTPVWKIADKDNFHAIRPFHLIDQQGKSFTEKDIENKICIVDFFFTSCPGICPKMTNNMSLLQDKFKADGNILLLSHSVTPLEDSVSVLAEYAKHKNVQYYKWRLLTGEKAEIYDLGRKYYFVEEDLGEKRDSSVFLHTENFVLIDKNRRIRGIYNGIDKTSIPSLIEDIEALEKEY
ncbi:SCO family protein [Parasediminibacterium sp. JCM 36343]|uniref:SCO family protein n=1 Tax=Parasediminibacterium sp. JCM 36343 TaxID=3374279 RepID=UPI00397D8F26